MTEKYILVTDDEYCYTLDTQSENYKTLEDFEKEEFENAKKDGIDIKDYEDAILEKASDNYWDWVYNNHLEADTVNDIINKLAEENEQLKQILREVEHELISITGLSAFDKCASQLGYVEVFDEDRIELDYNGLISKIDNVLDENKD